VQNEKRQGENQPYGRVYTTLLANSFPANHPYHHSTIGSMDDLNAASLETVKNWFRSYYGAANTVVVLAGDITPVIAKKKMLEYFGDIPAGPPVPRPQPWIAARTKSTSGSMTDNVPQVGIFREWNVPQLGDAQVPALDLATTVLGGGKTSRLYQRLVYKDKLADSVSVGINTNVVAGAVIMRVMVKKDIDPKKVEAAIADEWSKFLKQGPTSDELARAKITYQADVIRGLEKVGGFSGKAVTLAQGQVYQDNPGAWKTYYQQIEQATPEEVKKAANQWLAKGDYTLTVVPGKVDAKDVAEVAGRPVENGRPKDKLDDVGKYKTVASAVDRSTGVPQVNDFPDLSFPKLQHATLDNGIKVVLAERHSIPVVHMQMMFDAGYAADQGHKLGTSAFTVGMLDEGTTDMDSIEIAKRKERLGANIGSDCDLDICSVSLNALDSNLDASLNLYADIVRNPAFREADINRVRSQWLAGIAREKSQPTSLGLRILPPLLFGENNAYGIPMTGSGTEASIMSLTAEDMRGFMRDWIRPDNATLLVAGDTTLEKILPKLNAAFGKWPVTRNALPKKNLAHVDLPVQPRVFLLDRPGAQQTVILAGEVAPSTKAENYMAIDTMLGAFGGTFTSRLNMNLREDKHWAYGAFAFMPNAIGQRAMIMYAPVQTDKTGPSANEVLKEAKAILGDKPLTEVEVQKIKAKHVRSLPGKFETAEAVLGAMADIVKYDRPANYVETLKQKTDAITVKQAQAAAMQVIHPDKLTWVIVGDLKKIETPIRDLKLGTVEVIDADGKIIK
ncbi:MAG TPA: pitrilysin family protein, partial [Rudaea sp.]|nr:pitrilysin family protein [Rudaea sp.]